MPRRQTTQLDLFGGDPPAGRRARAIAAAPAPPELTALANRLPRGVRLGTSSWSFPGWAGFVWAGAHGTEALARDGLAAYARHPLLRAVGLDRTYYATIEAPVFARYAADVPEDFRFLVKAHEACTLPAFPHLPRHGAAAGSENARCLEPRWAADAVVAPAAEGLGAKLGAVLFQFAPLGRAETADPARFAARLHAFLAALPRGPLYAVELRNASLLGRDYVQALAASGAVHCLNAHPTMPDPASQRAIVREHAPAGGGSPPGAPCIVRWMLPRGLRYEEARDRYRPFDRLVEEDPATRHAIASIVRDAAAEGRESLVVINNKAEGSAPLSAFRLAEAIAPAPGGAPGDASPDESGGASRDVAPRGAR